MNRIFILAVIVTIASSNLNGQDIEIIYESVNKAPSDLILKELPEMKSKKILSRFTLRISGEQSIFKKDSIFLARYPQGFDTKEYQLDLKIYKNYNTDTWISFGSKYEKGKGYFKKISELIESNNHNWSIQNDSKNILGIDCIKAVSQNGSVAYYAPSLPIPDGPGYGINTLPGVILRYETTAEIFEAKEVKFEKINISQPELELYEDESKAKINMYDQNALKKTNAILIGIDTPRMTWIRFN